MNANGQNGGSWPIGAYYDYGTKMEKQGSIFGDFLIPLNEYQD